MSVSIGQPPLRHGMKQITDKNVSAILRKLRTEQQEQRNKAGIRISKTSPLDISHLPAAVQAAIILRREKKKNLE